jgi:hypothetical protein
LFLFALQSIHFHQKSFEEKKPFFFHDCWTDLSNLKMLIRIIVGIFAQWCTLDYNLGMKF